MKKWVVANVCLLIGAVMENADHKVVPFYFMTLAAMLMVDELREKLK